MQDILPAIEVYPVHHLPIIKAYADQAGLQDRRGLGMIPPEIGRAAMADERTGTEFGIATIVASHLLGEIERVCDFLVAIDAGKLDAKGTIDHAALKAAGVTKVLVFGGDAAVAPALARPLHLRRRGEFDVQLPGRARGESHPHR